jgi:hypothetical protein
MSESRRQEAPGAPPFRDLLQDGNHRHCLSCASASIRARKDAAAAKLATALALALLAPWSVASA